MKKTFSINKSALYSKADYTQLLTTKKISGFDLCYYELPPIEINSGAVCVFDAYDTENITAPFMQNFPSHRAIPFFMTVETNRGTRIAYAGLLFDDDDIVEWKLALFEERDIIKLSLDADSVSSNINSGIACIGDYIAMREYLRTIQNNDREFHPMDGIIKFDGNTALVHSLSKGHSFAIFSSGWGDGNYPSYIGYGPMGEATAIICDFGMIEHSKPKDSADEVLSFEFDMNVEQMYQNDPRLTQDENNIAKWSFVLDNDDALSDLTRYKAHARRGYSYHNTGNYKLALNDYYAALEIAENLEKNSNFRAHEWTLYDNAGTINREIGNIEEAKRLFTLGKAIGDSFYSGAYLNLIEIYMSEKDYENAMIVACEMIKNRPSDPMAYMKCAEIAVATESFDKAIENYDILIQRFDMGEMILEKSSCLAQLELYDKALENLETYLEDNKANEFFYYNKGYLEYKKLNYSKAYNNLLLALEYNPEFFTALHLLIEIDDLRLDYEKVAMWAGKYIDIRPESEYGYSVRADAYIKTGRFASAQTDYEAVSAFVKTDYEYQRRLVSAYCLERNFKKAKKLVKSFKKIDDYMYGHCLGILYSFKGKKSLAEYWFWLAKREDETEDSRCDIIEFFIRNNNYSMAEKLIDELFSIAPDSENVIFKKINICKAKKDEKGLQSLIDEYIAKFLPGIDESEKALIIKRAKTVNL